MTRARISQSPRAVVALSLALVAVGAWTVTHGQGGDAGRRQRFTHTGVVQDEQPPESGALQRSGAPAAGPAEAPSGFDNRTNGFSPQGPAFDSPTPT